MRRALVLFCVMCMICPSSSIFCNTFYRFSDQEIGNCTGDACVTYIYDGSVNMIGCASNVLFSNRTGCYDDADGNTICACQYSAYYDYSLIMFHLRSSYCNNYTLDELVHVDIAPKTSCFGHSASACKGLACTVERVNNESSDNCGFLGAVLDLVQLQANLIVIDQTTKEALNEDEVYFKYLGEDFRSNCVTSDSYNNLTCTGDFCYYQAVDGAVSRGCLTVEDKLAERKLSVGAYQYFMERIYLCDENLCNEDENSARENRSPDMGRLFTWPPLETFETTTDGGYQRVSTFLMIAIFSLWMSSFFF
ncbi:hypothetical protein PRIPAC_81085 [Pristionchus pacificus]|uniref:DUF7622 domain-containing protein n=1 Tax=Pristionchus pacificus TaxID=54126 RepID=A0A2A6CK72_PRIPA|nr:hypothetical protein PRIPAC_81085 [Pristionchus pacificus]|eukprot:PDM78592.1 hypothetical protein PRIPAC_31171 [Pristionchus pacificus]